jgi:GT2 family glycosyltransferase
VPISLSIVIPAYNSAQHLKPCLEALCSSLVLPLEIIVVDDGSSDNTRETAASFQVTVLSTEDRRGPAFARNLGAEFASGDVLVFLDSDVCVHHNTLQKIRASFDDDPELDALIGSYDSMPQSQDFLSQYRNLMHCYVHQTGAQRASTFWSGCGAIRRAQFLEHSGFNEEFGRPAIEDIELGYRLIQAGRKIILDRSLQITHLKRWTFWGLVKTDILDRGIPWTELILRDGFMPNDLNLQLSQRVSVALVFILVALSGFTALLWRGFFLIPLFAIVFLLLSRWWVEFAVPDRPLVAPVLLLAVVAVIAILAYSHGMFGLIPSLMLSPAVLLIGHRYAKTGAKRKLLRSFAIAYIGFSVFLAVLYLPANIPVFVCFIILAMLGLMNSQFYLFLAGKRGVPFMLAAVPFHLLYHFYNGISFSVGVLRHVWANLRRVFSGAAERAPAP